MGVKNTSEHMLIWAVICSMLLHGILAFVIPNFKLDAVKPSDSLNVKLVKQPEPPPVVLPEPIKKPAEPIKPKIEPKPEPKPIIKPLSIPTEIKSESALPPPTEVIAVAPKQEATPSPMPPVAITPPEPPKPVIPDTSAARDGYGNTLWGEISKHKQYPKIALMRGWQGEAIVEVLLDGNGKLKSKKIVQSSGYEALDKQALEMVESAAPFPAPPEVLRGSTFSIKVPIPFKLEN